ncbi:acyl carrier protein [Allosalinactinospora lopnorensis]|uniref:acyl carrier protein n=1 Tax=Allosalinactinospora lopnorensis TaxID=1352348 RepID=UPI00191C6C31|nr:acyl carrier protein [Allosalinactinospora lopnorensis]
MKETGVAEAAVPGEEELLARVRQAWAEVLGLGEAGEVPLDTNFLDAGGSSMLLIMLWEELNPLSSGGLRVSDLFQHSTVNAQVALLAGGGDHEATRVGARDRGRLLDRSRAGRSASDRGESAL